MDASEAEENLFSAGDAKLHREICQKLSTVVCKVLEIFPILESSRPRSKSGIQSLCSVHVALDKAKNLLQHCSTCSKLYLAITGDSVLIKFEKTKCALQESLRRVEDIVPHAIGCQIMEIVSELEKTTFVLDQAEKQAGDEVIQLLQKEKSFNGNSNDIEELETFHQAAIQLGITSSRAALTERRALKKLIERARSEEDKRKESIVAYLLYLMRKYSKLFRTEVSDETDSLGSAPCSPMLQGALEDNDGQGGNSHAFDKQFSKLSYINFKPVGLRSRRVTIPPEEFRCPISLQLMYDPVIISSGQTYERACIEKWFNDGHDTCPKTQQKLSHLCLTPNYCVKGLIGSWCEQNGFAVPVAPPDSLDVNYWRLPFSENEATDSRSMGSNGSCKSKSIEPVLEEESGTKEESSPIELENGDGMGNSGYSHSQDCEVDEFMRYENLLSVLCNGKCLQDQHNAVEQIRFLLKDDEEARTYMGANGFTEGLVQFLRVAVEKGEENCQEVGTMALFNLAVNNNRNKRAMLSAGVISLLEEMTSNSAYESATALYLNLSCVDDAKPIIGSSKAVPFLVELLKSDDCNTQCRADALHTLYNLSTHPPNITYLLSAGIVDGLHSLISGSDVEGGWTEKSIAFFLNLVSSKSGKREITSTPGVVGAIASVLDTGDPSEQEQAVSCLLCLCTGDQMCCHMVLQEGVIPALVSISVNGTPRGKEKAQKLLLLFRKQRQGEASPVRPQLRQPEKSDICMVGSPEKKPLVKTSKRKVGRTLTAMWKNKHFSVYQC